jgi:hypothetical protein
VSGDGPSVLTRLAEELCIQMARIVVCDFRTHSRLNRTVPAVLRNVRLTFWSCARRAALDTSAAPAAAAKRRVVQFSRRQKRYHVGVARGSAMECAALCDVLRVRRLAPLTETSRAKRLAVRCVQMLSKLEQALSKPAKGEPVEVA